MGATLWRGRDLMVIGPSYDSACHAQGQLRLRRSNAAAISPDGGWRDGLAEACAVWLSWVPHTTRQVRVPCAIGGRWAVLAATGTPATARGCAVATNDGSSSWRCCDTGIRVGVFGSSTRTGDEDNAVILAAAVCFGEIAQD